MDKIKRNKIGKGKRLYESKEDFVYMILFFMVVIGVVAGFVIGEANHYEAYIEDKSTFEELVYVIEDKDGKALMKNYVDSNSDKISFYFNTEGRKGLKIRIYDSYGFANQEPVYSEDLEKFKNKRKIILRN